MRADLRTIKKKPKTVVCHKQGWEKISKREVAGIAKIYLKKLVYWMQAERKRCWILRTLVEYIKTTYNIHVLHSRSFQDHCQILLQLLNVFKTTASDVLLHFVEQPKITANNIKTVRRARNSFDAHLASHCCQQRVFLCVHFAYVQISINNSVCSWLTNSKLYAYRHTRHTMVFIQKIVNFLNLLWGSDVPLSPTYLIVSHPISTVLETLGTAQNRCAFHKN